MYLYEFTVKLKKKKIESIRKRGWFDLSAFKLNHGILVGSQHYYRWYPHGARSEGGALSEAVALSPFPPPLLLFASAVQQRAEKVKGKMFVQCLQQIGAGQYF